MAGDQAHETKPGLVVAVGGARAGDPWQTARDACL